MIIYDYEYDLIHQPFFSEILDSENSITIKFTVPDGMKEISGFMIKLSRDGKPGSINYTLSFGNDRVREGEILPSEVTPVFELLVKKTFDRLSAREGETFFLSLKVDNGKMPLDGYRIYGPSQRCQGREGFDKAESIPYWWSQEHSFGMAVPTYYKPAEYEGCSWCCTLKEDNTEGPSLTFGLLSKNDEKHTESQVFEFIKELTAPPFSEWDKFGGRRYSLKSLGSKDDSCVFIDDSWRLDFSAIAPQSLLMLRIKEEAKSFFKKVFDIDLKGSNKAITFEIDQNDLPDGKESHVVFVQKEKITLKARCERGLLRALYYIEDLMLEERQAAIKTGIHVRRCLYNIRMTNGIYPNPFNYYSLKSSGIWDRGYMWRLSRSGYNAIWFIVNLEEIVLDSRIFPEMNEPDAATTMERLKRITEIAAEYGVDVFIEIRTGYYKMFEEKIYERLPQIRSFEKWANYPCTGNEFFRDFLRETLLKLIDHVPELKGLIIIYDTEGFYNCFANGRQNECPVCRGKKPENLAAEFFSTLREGVKSKERDTSIIAWTYFCDTDWNYRIIESLPEDITVMSVYSQFTDIDRLGVKNTTDDYCCGVTGPGEYFNKVYNAAKKNGKKVITKTEVSFGNEFVSTPYIPSLIQFQKRWDSMSGKNLEGFMGDYLHNGFKPSPCIDLMRVNSFSTQINDCDWLSSEEKIKWVASLNFGKAAVGMVVKAWELFSKAISENFPFSSGVCRYPGPLQAGPSQPFYLDKNRKVKRTAAGYNVGDLGWTKQKPYEMNEPGWDEELVKSCFISFIDTYNEGIACLEMIVKSEGDDNKILSGMLNTARMQACMAESMVNFIEFVKLREQLDEVSCLKEIVKEILFVCEKERLNARKALLLCEDNSILGFACENQGIIRGGHFTAFTVKEKIKELDCTIDELNNSLISFCNK